MNSTRASQDQRVIPLPWMLTLWINRFTFFFPILMLVEAATSSTALITPLSSAYLWAMTAIGFATGIWICRFGIAKDPRSERENRAKTTLRLLGVSAFAAVAFNGFGWRIADWLEFGLSNEPFQTVVHPIKDVSVGFRGNRDHLEIDPFSVGDSTPIPIPPEQLQFGRASLIGRCVAVEQRKSASGAIEIQTDGKITFFKPKPAIIQDC